MRFEAFGKSLLVAESKSNKTVGGIMVATVGKLKSGTVLSLGEQVFYETDLLKVGDEIVYVAEKAVPFEFGEPNVVVVNIDDIVAFEKLQEAN